MAKALEKKEIDRKLRGLPFWSLRKLTIRRSFTFDDFPQGIDFVRRIALHAQKINHHPDINVRFDKVTLALTTHDAGGLTAKDFSLAEQCDAAYRRKPVS